jgi:hypothetical protein
MARESQKLNTDLFFGPDPSPDRWLTLLDTVTSWAPRAAPRQLERDSDADWNGQRESWTASRRQELANRCAGDASFAWSLYGDNAALLAAREPHYVKVSVILPAPEIEPGEWLRRLLNSLADSPPLKLAMLLDPDSLEDSKLMLQGPERLTDIPPIFYLDHSTMALLGGPQRLRHAPVDVEDVPGGLLFRVRPPFGPPSPASRANTKAMRAYLGISARTPLSLIAGGDTEAPTGVAQWSLVQWWPGPADGRLAACHAIAPDDIWSVGEAGLTVHWDGGDWSVVETSAATSFSALWGLEGGSLWAAGEHGQIHNWDGADWIPTSHSGNQDITGLWGSAPDNIFAVGGDGMIAHWNGRAWAQMPRITRGALAAIAGTNPQDAWAVGEAGTLVHWNGEQWSTVNCPVQLDLHAIYASPSGEVWAVGDQGCLLNLRNGSSTRVDSGTVATLRAVFARDSSDIWVAGNDCTIRHWNGHAWTQIESDTNETLSGIAEAGDDGVWVVGTRATILQLVSV